MSDWTFLTNHAHVLLLLARNPDMRMRELARRVGITERAIHRVVHDLTDAGYVDVEKVGRCNHYRVRKTMPMRHPVEEGACVQDLLGLLERQVESVS